MCVFVVRALRSTRLTSCDHVRVMSICIYIYIDITVTWSHEVKRVLGNARTTKTHIITCG